MGNAVKRGSARRQGSKIGRRELAEEIDELLDQVVAPSRDHLSCIIDLINKELGRKSNKHFSIYSRYLPDNPVGCTWVKDQHEATLELEDESDYVSESSATECERCRM